MGWWPLRFRRRSARVNQSGRRRTAYIMWHFPLLSETFIQREITALKHRGMRITVVADAITDSDLLVEGWRRLIPGTIAILPLDQRKLSAYSRYFFRVRPLRSLNNFLFLLLHRYHDRKSYRFDLHVYRKTIYIAGVCRELGVTHIHSPWSDLNAITGLLAARLLGVPFSVQGRAHDIHRQTYKHGLKELFRYADLVITNTNYNAGYLKEIIGGNGNHGIARIYNGLPLQQFPYQAPCKIEDRPLRIVTVARLIEQKGLDDLIHVCRRLRETGIPFRAVVVGGPEEGYEKHYRYLLRMQSDYELHDIVHFAGEKSLDQVIDYYRASDIFILPSKIASDGSRDIIPNALIEAMAVGLPCVSTRVTGIPEIIDDGVNGLLCEAGDIDGMTEAILILAKSIELRCKLSVNARQKVESHFDIDRNIDGYVQAFASIGAF